MQLIRHQSSVHLLPLLDRKHHFCAAAGAAGHKILSEFRFMRSDCCLWVPLTFLWRIVHCTGTWLGVFSWYSERWCDMLLYGHWTWLGKKSTVWQFDATWAYVMCVWLCTMYIPTHLGMVSSDMRGCDRRPAASPPWSTRELLQCRQLWLFMGRCWWIWRQRWWWCGKWGISHKPRSHTFGSFRRQAPHLLLVTYTHNIISSNHFYSIVGFYHSVFY